MAIIYTAPVFAAAVLSTKPPTAVVEVGGYDYDFVDEEYEEYVCPACMLVMRQPALTRCCGKHFCLSCGRRHDSGRRVKTCMLCRSQANYDYGLNKETQRKINALKIKCGNKPGCLWKGELGQLEAHIRSSCPQNDTACVRCGKHGTSSIELSHPGECPDVPVPCPNKCGEEVKRKNITQHREVCLLEKVTCAQQGPNETGEFVACRERVMRGDLAEHRKVYPFRSIKCKKSSTYIHIMAGQQSPTSREADVPGKGHYAECHEYPLLCRNRCTMNTIRRADMEQHLKECPLEIVPCERLKEGCKVKVPRKDMELHVKNCKSQHCSPIPEATNGRIEAHLRNLPYKTDSFYLVKISNKLQNTTEELELTREDLVKTEATLQEVTKERAKLEGELKKERQWEKAQSRILQNMEAELMKARKELDTLKRDLMVVRVSNEEKARKLEENAELVTALREERDKSNTKLAETVKELEAVKKERAESQAAGQKLKEELEKSKLKLKKTKKKLEERVESQVAEGHRQTHTSEYDTTPGQKNPRC